MINLSDSVIIIVSDLGNGDFIVAMFEQASERERNLNALMVDLNRSHNWQQPDSSVWEEYLKQVTKFNVFEMSISTHAFLNCWVLFCI